MREHLIPQDTQWNDIDYMSRHKDFTIGDLRFHGLDQFVDELHKDGMHYIMILVSNMVIFRVLYSYCTLVALEDFQKKKM